MVPEIFKNVICPWQTERDIKSQSRFLNGMLKRLNPSEEELKKLLLLDRLDWVWKR